MRRNKATFIYASLGALLVIGLFAYPRLFNPDKKLIASIQRMGLECLPGHQRLNQHFHPHITIMVDGLEEPILANIGIFRNCMAEIHTHDATGTIHVESILPAKAFYLKSFFEVYGKSVEREGYATEVEVNGAPNGEFGNLVLEEGQQIVLKYTRKQ